MILLVIIEDSLVIIVNLLVIIDNWLVIIVNSLVINDDLLVIIEDSLVIIEDSLVIIKSIFNLFRIFSYCVSVATLVGWWESNNEITTNNPKWVVKISS